MRKKADALVAGILAGSLVFGVPVAGLSAVTGGTAGGVREAAAAEVDAITIPDGVYKIAVSMSDPNNENMVQVYGKTGLLIVENGKQSARFRMGGTGVDYLYLGTCSEAEAASSSSWIKYTSLKEKTGKFLVEHYYFTVPVTITATGETTLPLAIHSKKYKEWYRPDRTISFTYTGTEANAASSLTPAKVKKVKATSPKKKQSKVTWGAVSKNVTKYEVRYSLKKNMKSAKTKSVNAYKTNSDLEAVAGTSATVKKLKSGKKYYVQVRGYNWTSDSYGAWSAKKSVKVK